MTLARIAAAIALVVFTRNAHADKPKDCAGRPRFVSGSNVFPSVLKRVDPDLRSCKGRYSGNPVVTATITSTGEPRNVRLAHSIAPCVDQAVVAAIRQWRFCAGEVNGKPKDVEMSFTVAIHYK
jgi:TonB family protein